MSEELWFIAECEDLRDETQHRVWVYRNGSSVSLRLEGKGTGVPADASNQEDAESAILFKLEMLVKRTITRAEAVRIMNQHVAKEGVASVDGELDTTDVPPAESLEKHDESSPNERGSVA